MKERPPLPPGPYLVVGLARSGVAAALALRARGEEVVGVDAGRVGDDALGTLQRAGVRAYAREAGDDRLAGVASVVKSPGVPDDAAPIVSARAAGVEVIGELELGWRLLGNEFIAVTGTNGKTTTSHLIAHIHDRAHMTAALAGNVGTPVSSLAGAPLDPEAVVVCEVSSFQLEDANAFAPEAAVLLNITPDHLDRHGTFAAYTAAKLSIFARQGAADVAVTPCDLALPEPLGAGRRVCFGECADAPLQLLDRELRWHNDVVVRADEVRLRGAHNLQNAMAAAAVCLARGLDLEAVRDGLASFAGVAHRLEEVGRARSVLFVNDSKATNVASTLVALAAFERDGRSVHLIAGGRGKDQDFAPLAAAVDGTCAGVYLIGEDAPAIAHALAGTGVKTCSCGELERALAKAVKAATTDQVVLLSPACASFDQFADFEERGERFRALVHAYL